MRSRRISGSPDDTRRALFDTLVRHAPRPSVPANPAAHGAPPRTEVLDAMAEAIAARAMPGYQPAGNGRHAEFMGWRPSDMVRELLTLDGDTAVPRDPVPFAAILAKIGDKWEHATAKQKLARWYWCGIFGELYGSAIESRFAKDILEVPAWIDGGPEPSTVRDGVFRSERLRSMRTRQSAAYKGVHALLMGEGAIDFRSGQAFGQTIFFDEGVDIHHIFPQDWCRKQGIDVRVFDTIINKTPLGYRTNRTIGGAAPSAYLEKLEAGGRDAPAIAPGALDGYLRSHAAEPALLRADAFADFMADRETRLLALISAATGHQISRGGAAPEEGEDVIDDALEADIGTAATAEQEAA